MEQKIDYKGYTIEIHHDDDPLFSPRENDNITELHCCHKRSKIGDFNYQNVSELENIVIEAHKNRDIVLNLYMYDHGMIVLSLTPFSRPWGSGQVGFVIIRREKILKEFNKKIITNKTKTKVLEIASDEIDIYNKYLRGDVWGYIIVEKNESCWGYYGVDNCINAAKELVDCIEKNEKVA